MSWLGRQNNVDWPPPQPLETFSRRSGYDRFASSTHAGLHAHPESHDPAAPEVTSACWAISRVGAQPITQQNIHTNRRVISRSFNSPKIVQTRCEIAVRWSSNVAGTTSPKLQSYGCPITDVVVRVAARRTDGRGNWAIQCKTNN